MKKKINKTLYSEIRGVSLSDDIDTGALVGYGNVKGCLDSHGTIMINGCYKNSIPEFLKNGFLCDTHGADAFYIPTLDNVLGYFVSAIEDDYGLLVEAVFDPSERAQEARAKIAQRLAAGVNTGMSIGFSIRESFLIYAKDYATELPKYLAPQFFTEGMKNANNFPCVEIVTEVGLIETSATVIPSNTASLITEVRTRSAKNGLAYNYKNFNKNKEQNFLDNNMELRAGKKIGADTHKELMKHLDDMDDAHEAMGDHIKGVTEEHRKHGKRLRDMRKKLDDLHDKRDDDDDKRDDDDDKKDKKDDKRAGELDDIYATLDAIKKKMNLNTEKK